MERRSAPRRQVNIRTTSRAPAVPGRSTLLDISQTGCRLALRDATVLQGSTVHIEFGQGQKLSGTATWSEGSRIGVHFHRRLSNKEAIQLGLKEGPPAPKVTFDNDYAAEGGLQHWVRKVLHWTSSRR